MAYTRQTQRKLNVARIDFNTQRFKWTGRTVSHNLDNDKYTNFGCEGNNGGTSKVLTEGLESARIPQLI
jgi:hypothetical protein